MRYGTVQYVTVGTVQYDTVLCEAWNGTVFVEHGTVWYGMTRYGTVRYGTVQYGMICVYVYDVVHVLAYESLYVGFVIITLL